MSNNSKTTVAAVKASLSSARIATYEVATGVAADDDMSALVLYAWNAQVSGALLAPLHICEVAIRNTVADVLEAVYGNEWPWSTSFERSLPDPIQGYSPRKDLQGTRASALTTGKLIPELKFIFWQKMFTRRYDDRLWTHHLPRVLPNMDASTTVAERRLLIYNDLEQLRKLRNRIAHHEPIFTRVLANDYQKILNLVRCRCTATADWMHHNQTASTVISAKPF